MAPSSLTRSESEAILMVFFISPLLFQSLPTLLQTAFDALCLSIVATTIVLVSR